jgi:hypothetical protein
MPEIVVSKAKPLEPRMLSVLSPRSQVKKKCMIYSFKYQMSLKPHSQTSGFPVPPKHCTLHIILVQHKQLIAMID